MRFSLKAFLLIFALTIGCQDAQLSPHQPDRVDERDQSSAHDPANSSPHWLPPGNAQQNSTVPSVRNPVMNTTNGTGGPKGSVTSGTFDQRGEYLVWAPADNAPDKAHGLLVLLHGSRASSYATFLRENGQNAMIPVARKHGLIAVSVKAPNGQGWNEGNQVAAATYLHNFVTQRLFNLYNIDKSRIYFSGQSSGGGFLATHFVPSYGNDYSGGALFQCGTGRPANELSFQPSTQMQQNFRIHMEITSGDGIWTRSFAEAVPAYKSLGLQVTSDNSKSGGHCAFDQATIIDQYLSI